MPDDLHIECFTLGPFETNCYVVSCAEACWIVDASFGPEELIRHVKSRGFKVEALILTHAHVDHIAGVADVRRAFPALPVWIHGAEAAWLNDPLLNLSGMMDAPVTAPGPDRLLADGDILRLGETSWRVLHTPGHSPGGITLVCDTANTAIVGDTLFAGSVGRMDLPGGDEATLTASIRRKLYVLPDSMRVLPGHGSETTIGREKRTNPFVRG